jgi:ribonuclease HII
MIELKLISKFPHTIIATDEVGRGPLSGPVVAGAICLDIHSKEELKSVLKALKKVGIQDSKKLSSYFINFDEGKLFFKLDNCKLSGTKK